MNDHTTQRTCYIISRHSIRRATQIRRTKTTITAQDERGNAYVFTIGKYQNAEDDKTLFYQRGGGDLTLSFDAVKMEQRIKADQEHRDRRMRMNEVKDRLQKAIQSPYNGFGECCVTEEELTRLERAVSIIHRQPLVLEGYTVFSLEELERYKQDIRSKRGEDAKSTATHSFSTRISFQEDGSIQAGCFLSKP